MNQDRAGAVSPFSALTYQEQQTRWMEWRSRQLDYQPSGSTPPDESRARGKEPARQTRQERETYPTSGGLPPLRVPNMPIAAPTRHQELDQVISRHQKALRQAGQFQTAALK